MATCDACGEPSTLRCSRCKSARYCSRTCQVAAFKEHKKVCEPVREAVHGSAAGLGAESSGETTAAQQQQSLMLDREPELLAAVSGEFSYTVAELGESVHPRDIPVGHSVTVRWVDSRTGTRAKRAFRWYDSASIASELWTLAVGAIDRHRVVAGGPLTLLGDTPDVFWSMALHRRWTRLCAPPAQVADQDWIGGTWAGLHLQRALAMAREQDSASQRRAIALPSPSAAASFALAGLRTGFELPCFSEACPSPVVPSTIAALPRWWTDATLPWERVWDATAAAAAAAGSSKAAAARGAQVCSPCAYFMTETGCAAGASACLASHDSTWAAAVETWRRDAPRLIGTGGEVVDDADELPGRAAARPRSDKQSATRDDRPTPNGLASTAAWHVPDAAAVAELEARAVAAQAGSQGQAGTSLGS